MFILYIFIFIFWQDCLYCSLELQLQCYLWSMVIVNSLIYKLPLFSFSFVNFPLSFSSPYWNVNRLYGLLTIFFIFIHARSRRSFGFIIPAVLVYRKEFVSCFWVDRRNKGVWQSSRQVQKFSIWHFHEYLSGKDVFQMYMLTFYG